MSNARIGRQIKHFEKIDLETIEAKFSKDMLNRTLLTLDYVKDEKRTKTAVVVLKNPSSADEKKADKTIYNVEKVVYEAFEDVGVVYILNLFSLRATDAIDLQNNYKKNLSKKKIGMVGYDESNTRAFTDILSIADYCICAWGGRSDISKTLYDEAVNSFLEIARNAINIINPTMTLVRKKGKGSNRYPFHACYWKHDKEFLEINNTLGDE